MNDQLYREIILEHWKNPQNFGVIELADVDISDNNPLCGDETRITAKLSGVTIEDVKFEGNGCAISIAAGSILSENIKGKSIEEVSKFSQQDFLDLLEITLTPGRLKCALLNFFALKKGLIKINF